MLKDSKKMPMFILFLILAASMNIFATGKTDQSELSQSTSTSVLTIKERAELWSITEADFLKYTGIMKGPLKHWNPNIDPVLALGIFAESEADKNRFAEIYAQQEYHLTQKTIAFERRYRAAFRLLYPDAEIISSDLMAPYHAHQGNRAKNRSGTKNSGFNLATDRLMDGDRILYFVDGNCQDCQSNVDHLQRLVKNKLKLSVDFYITHITDEHDARRWASSHNVDIVLVKASRVTINVDDGAHQKLIASANQETEFFLHRQDNIYAVSKTDIFSQ